MPFLRKFCSARCFRFCSFCFLRLRLDSCFCGILYLSLFFVFSVIYFLEDFHATLNYYVVGIGWPENFVVCSSVLLKLFALELLQHVQAELSVCVCACLPVCAACICMYEYSNSKSANCRHCNFFFFLRFLTVASVSW